MKASLRVPDLENLKISSSPSELSSMATKLGRGRGLAITFKNEYLNNAKDDDDAQSIYSIHSTRTKFKGVKNTMGRKSSCSDTIKSEDDIIYGSKAPKEDDPEITKTYSLYSCWPSVEDKIWKCWDKSSKIEEIKDDDNNEFLLDYDRRSSSSKSNVKPFPKATVPSYPKENVASYPKGNIASIEITAKPYRSNYSSYYDPTSYSISLPIKMLPRKFYNKLNNSKPEGEFSYRFDTGYDPSLSSRRRSEDDDKYNYFHRRINTPYTRKINYWRSKDNTVDKTSEVKDPISALYIWCSRNRAIPTFVFTSELESLGEVMVGFVFVCKITLFEHETTGKGTTKKEAKRAAAEKMLDIINSGFEKGNLGEEKETKDVKVESDEEETTDDEEETSDSEEEADDKEEKSDDEEKKSDDGEKDKTDDEEGVEKVENEDDKDKLNKEETLESNECEGDEEEKAQTGGDEKTKDLVEVERKPEKKRSDKKSKCKVKNKKEMRSGSKVLNQTVGVMEFTLDQLKKLAEKKVATELGNKTECKSDTEDETDSDDGEEEPLEENNTDNEENTDNRGKTSVKVKKSVKDAKLDKNKMSRSVKKTKSHGKEAVPKVNRKLSDEECMRHLNPISFLQEVCIKHPDWTVPTYKIENFGSIFKCQIQFVAKGEKVDETGFGHTKKEAKTKAASNAVRICEERKFISKSK